ncbi:MAG TPA: GAF domain-containing protein, partial [Planctomycetota bacterium]|nr:GAF domain-containing protein [Planctomycetota bacterium]
SQLALDTLLERTAQAAGELAGGRCAALAVVGEDGSSLKRLFSWGMDERMQTVLSEHMALSHVAEPPSKDTPPCSFFELPILVRGNVFGRLYFPSEEGELTQEDVAVLTALAAHAAVAIESASLYEASTRQADQLKSLDEVLYALARARGDRARFLELIADRLRQRLQACAVTVWLSEQAACLRLTAVSGEAPATLRGIAAPEESKLVHLWNRRSSGRVDSVLDDPEINQAVARKLGMRNGLWVPLEAGGRALGMVAAYNKLGRRRTFTDDDVRLAEVFAARTAIALRLFPALGRLRGVSAVETKRHRSR